MCRKMQFFISQILMVTFKCKISFKFFKVMCVCRFNREYRPFCTLLSFLIYEGLMVMATFRLYESPREEEFGINFSYFKAKLFRFSFLSLYRFLKSTATIQAD